MHYGNDVDQSRVDPVKDGVREALHELPAKVSINGRTQLRTRLNPAERDTEVVAKPLSESFTTVFVETESAQGVSLCLG